MLWKNLKTFDDTYYNDIRNTYNTLTKLKNDADILEIATFKYTFVKILTKDFYESIYVLNIDNNRWYRISDFYLKIYSFVFFPKNNILYIAFKDTEQDDLDNIFIQLSDKDFLNKCSLKFLFAFCNYEKQIETIRYFQNNKINLIKFIKDNLESLELTDEIKIQENKINFIETYKLFEERNFDLNDYKYNLL